MDPAPAAPPGIRAHLGCGGCGLPVVKPAGPADARGRDPKGRAWQGRREAFVRCPEPRGSKPRAGLRGASAGARAPPLIAANFVSLTLFTLKPLNCFPFIFSNFIMH